MTAKFNSEVVIMKFLRETTRISSIGYGFDNDDESPVPFMIMENVVRFSLNVFYSRFRERFPHAIDRVLDFLLLNNICNYSFLPSTELDHFV